MNENPYKKAMEYVDFDTKFEEQTISLMVGAAQKKKSIRQVRLPVGAWRYIAAAAAIALFFAAVPFIRGLQNTTETAGVTVPMVMTAAGDEMTSQSEAISNETIAMTTLSADVYSPGTVTEDGTMYVSSTTSRMIPRSMNELVNVADNIFSGLCVSSEPVFQNDFLYTLSKVQVTAVFKGAFQVGDIVPVIEMGGRTTIGEYRKETTVEIKDFDHYDDSIPADTKLVEGMDGFFPLKVEDNVLLFAADASGFLNNFTGPLYSIYGDYEGKMYFRNENVYARNTPSNTDKITFDDISASISLDELRLLIEDSK